MADSFASASGRLVPLAWCCENRRGGRCLITADGYRPYTRGCGPLAQLLAIRVKGGGHLAEVCCLSAQFPDAQIGILIPMHEWGTGGATLGCAAPMTTMGREPPFLIGFFTLRSFPIPSFVNGPIARLIAYVMQFQCFTRPVGQQIRPQIEAPPGAPWPCPSAILIALRWHGEVVARGAA